MYPNVKPRAKALLLGRLFAWLSKGLLGLTLMMPVGCFEAPSVTPYAVRDEADVSGVMDTRGGTDRNHPVTAGGSSVSMAVPSGRMEEVGQGAAAGVSRAGRSTMDAYAGTVAGSTNPPIAGRQATAPAGGSSMVASTVASMGGAAMGSAGGMPDVPTASGGAAVERIDCEDDRLNGAETDVDCGGDCRPCTDGSGCEVAADCVSGVCQDRRCAASRCGDGIVNGIEDCDFAAEPLDPACQADCTHTGCGNGRIDAGEGDCDCPDGLLNADGDIENGCECARIGPVDASCDGVDDDCDGRLDEDYASAREAMGRCAFEGLCQSTGRQMVTETTCLNGRPVEMTMEVACQRNVPDGVVETGEWSVCEHVDDACALVGTRSRQRTICRDGDAVQDTETEACERMTDGLRIAEGPWLDCAGFEDECDEQGVRTRAVTTCAGGQQIEMNEEEPCERETDDVPVMEGVWSECGSFSDACDTLGTRSRESIVCANGVPQPMPETEDCERAIDTVVIQLGEWGACVGRASVCPVEGVQTRTNTLCIGGLAGEQDETQGCTVNSDGRIVSTTPWTDCGGFGSECHESGTRSREQKVCQNGRLQDETVFEDCTRDTDGQRISTGQWGACHDFAGPCSEHGRRLRLNRVCQDGDLVNVAEVEDCERTTAGRQCQEFGSSGLCSEGACIEF
ncbi:MAG: hypothetical protein VX589_19590 [Myxococcota bacterium]|nr:hypothetical protein [Myxococcota bacterium]